MVYVFGVNLYFRNSTIYDMFVFKYFFHRLDIMDNIAVVLSIDIAILA